jgi:hypothetical protein
VKGAVPDARAIVERVFEVGDTVIVEGRFTGTNSGPLPGPDGDLAPSGRTVDLPFADFARISDTGSWSTAGITTRSLCSPSSG